MSRTQRESETTGTTIVAQPKPQRHVVVARRFCANVPETQVLIRSWNEGR
jgi:hypothetical protein